MTPALPGTRPRGRPGHAVAAGAAAVSGLAGRAVSALRGPRRLTWDVELDVPVGLTPGQAPGADWAMIIEEAAPGPVGHDGAAARGWLVLITLINTGPTPVSGQDFREPLAFRFPGREARAAQAAPAPAGTDPGRRAPALPPALCIPDGDSVILRSGLRLGKGEALTLTAVLRGIPALGLPPVSQRGSLPGWTITAVSPDALA